MLAKKGLMTAPAAVAQYVEDVFSTYLYTGNDSTQTITNGIDLSGEGGLIWLKKRNNTSIHGLWDTARGGTKRLDTSSTGAESTLGSSFTFNSDGFTIPAGGSSYLNESSANTYASWTFRKAEKFFDVVTYTGNGTAGRTVSHNLGSTPGCIIVKRTDSSTNWRVYHRSLGATKYLNLDETMGENTATTIWNDTAPTSTVFSVGTNAAVNASGGTYVAYLFAHDAGGFGDAGDQSVIKCGSFTTNGSAIATVDLGWEPQWILYKASSATQNWEVYDNMRGMTATAGNAVRLAPNLSDAEVDFTGGRTTISSTGFSVNNLTSTTYVYIAIRRGPMKTPEAGTEVYNSAVFSGNDGTQTYSNGFPTDFILHMTRNAAGYSRLLCDRLRGKGPRLNTASTDAESNLDLFNFDKQNSVSFTSAAASVNASGTDYTQINFRRAPGFFDIVNVKTNQQASAITSSHNLGAVPEMMITKKRGPNGGTGDWMVYHKDFNGGVNPQNYRIRLTAASTVSADSGIWNNTAPTSTQFTIGTDSDVNSGSAGDSTIVYLFGSVSGVSKVGSYTGTGTTLQINCGFAAGARFVLIKRTDNTGDWYVWDTARGIVSGNDPYLLMNSQNAEVTNTDYIDTYSAGFEISSTAPAAINANGGTFIYLAIA